MYSHSTSGATRTRSATLPGLDYSFDRPELLTQALTHRSLGNPHNERLEFLGDSVLNMVVSDLLFHLRPAAPEGDLSRLRARLVRDRTLAEIARELNLGDHLRLGPGELKSGGFLRESILADALEAIIGAAFIDRGFEQARELVTSLMRSRLETLPEGESLKDAKTRLQEVLQGQGLELPAYEVIDEQGKDHARRFTVVCRIPLLDRPVEATAGSRRKAEQAAASLALRRIDGEQGVEPGD